MKNLLLLIISLLFFSCTNPAEKKAADQSEKRPIKYPLSGLTPTIFQDSIKIIGGYGSDLFPHPSLEDAFYLLTDRGPNYDWISKDGSEAKGFAIPDYTPRIGLFVRKENTYELVKTILLKGPDGQALTGLPNLPGKGGTNEAAYAADSSLLENDPNGIDPEGLVALKNGDFWVSDEYGPYLMRFDSNGVLKEKFSPFDVDHDKGNSLPRVFRKRRPNRGMEGLTITPDGTKLVGIMQSALYNPDKSVKKYAKICRIMTFDLTTSQTQQYAYVQDYPGLALSGICAISNDKFLVIERDSDYPEVEVDPGKVVISTPSEYKTIMEIDLSEATDISDPRNGALGLTYKIDIADEDKLGEVKDSNTDIISAGYTIEQLKDSLGLAKVGIKPVRKRMVYDLLFSEIPYLHDKAEGIAFFPKDSCIAIVNDNDFAIDSDKKRGVFQKLNRMGEMERTEIYFLKLN
ncbi:MAG: esterase-like activity of phytase family protein [Bacteroidia bacterium]|nr:esterase-like activity of phytase family protein [Bacteroidia bacterium]